MRNPTYLIRSRHQIYYFRWPLPRQIRKSGKTNHVKISLQTREPKEALRLATLLQDHVFNLLRQDWVLTMDYSEIKAMVEEHFAKLLEERKREIDKNGPLLPFPMARCRRSIKRIEDSLNGVETDYSVLKDYDNDSELDRLVTSYGFELPNTDKDRLRLNKVYWLAVKGMLQEVIAHSDSQEKFNFGTTVQSNGAPTVRKLARPENRLDRVAEKYVTEMTKAAVWGIRATEERKDCFKYLQELLGVDFDVPRFDVITARGVKEALQKTPVNRNKLKEARTLPLSEQIKLEGLPTLSPGSVNKYLQCFSSFFKWVVAHGYADKNPFEGLGMKEGNKKRREYFRPEQVKTLLTELAKEKSGLLNSDMKYWGLMIGLYTGARLNEVSSLTPDDVRQDKKTGIWYFDINDEEEQKRLKTEAAKRYVPIHSVLLEHGFLTYVEEVRKKNGKGLRLLYGLTFDEKEGWGRKLGRWFNDVFLPKVELKKQGVSFHSLRHTVITNLRRSGVDTFRQVWGILA